MSGEVTTALFSDDGSSIVNKNLDVEALEIDDSIIEYFDLSSLVVELKAFHKIALQIPNEILKYSTRIFQYIQQNVGGSVCILADTTYGSCCIDEIGAEHYHADVIVHFGHSCLSYPESSIMVKYAFGKRKIDVKNCVLSIVSKLKASSHSRAFFMCSVEYLYCISEFKDYFEQLGNGLEFIFPKVPLFEDESPNLSDGYLISGRLFPYMGKDSALPVIFLGDEGPTLRNLSMVLNQSPVLFVHQLSTLDFSCTWQSLTSSKALMRRYFLVEKAKDAELIGILIGSINVEGNKKVVDEIVKLIEEEGKKCIVLAVGQLNVAKLANIPEVDVFVNVACAENTLIDSRDFYAPIITPYELNLALTFKAWSGNYITDYAQVFPGLVKSMDHCTLSGNASYSQDTEEHEEEEVRYSLVSGRLVPRRAQFRKDDQKKAGEITVRSSEFALAVGGNHQFKREWQGLDMALGQSTVGEAKEGRSGHTQGYEDEHAALGE
eukprot:GCRY01000986.1.p2 GENE.GCRY01000986.1~~GCRY01000986.1.p2  ORF type:complete len:492 (-),score=40.41 GCRY01000986.1:188-1663(-)